MPLFDPSLATRRKLKAGLVVAGALAGFVFGLILTRLGKIVAGAPPATIGNYLWNAVFLAVMAGICSPILSWAFLQRAPLWRTILEPLIWMAAGGAAAVTLGVPVLILILPPIGLAVSIWNLRRRYPDHGVLPSHLDETPRLHSANAPVAESPPPRP